MKLIESYGDTDFVWSCAPKEEPTTLIAYYQSEQGFASFIAGASIVAESDATCNVLSKLHPIDPMNALPSPVVPAWRIYETRNEDGRRYFILRINQTYIPSPTQTKAWLYNYPVFRDITMCLSKYGVDELVYLTSNLMQDFIYSDQAQIPEKELIVYDYNERDETLYLTDGSSLDFHDITLPPPSWIFTICFAHFCTNPMRGNYIVVASKDHTTFVNEREGERLLEFLEDTHALLPDEMYKREFLEVLYEAESEMQ
tara:strand:+ start:206 stop:973 length:768 start_codon:yes stop_codon:yes gene_type:complete